jgi:hypothetical protein
MKEFYGTSSKNPVEPKLLPNYMAQHPKEIVIFTFAATKT